MRDPHQEGDWAAVVVDPMDETNLRLVDVGIGGQSCDDGNRLRRALALPVNRPGQCDMDSGVVAVEQMGS